METSSCHARHEFEQAFADSDDGTQDDLEEPCDDLPHDWVHLEECTKDDEGKVTAGKCNVLRIQKLVASVKAYAKRAAGIMRKACRTLVRDRIDGGTQEADKQMYKYLRRDQSPRAAAMYDPDSNEFIFDTHGQSKLMIRRWSKVFQMHKG